MQPPERDALTPATETPPRQLIALGYRPLDAGQDDQLGVVYRATVASDGSERLIRAWAPLLRDDVEFRARIRHRTAGLSALAAHERTLPRILDAEIVSGRTVLFVTDALDSPCLGDWLAAERPLDRLRAVRLGLRVGGALEALHNAGFVHGCLSPRHVDVRSGDDIRLRGLEYAALPTRLLRSMNRDAPPFAAAYLAPEQLRGEEPREAADIYAYGCLLGELLGEAARATGYRWRRQPQLPLSVRRMLVAARDRSPAERPASIGEMVNELWGRSVPELVAGAGPRRLARSVAVTLVGASLIGALSLALSRHESGTAHRSPAASPIPVAPPEPVGSPDASAQPARAESAAEGERGAVALPAPPPSDPTPPVAAEPDPAPDPASPASAEAAPLRRPSRGTRLERATVAAPAVIGRAARPDDSRPTDRPSPPVWRPPASSLQGASGSPGESDAPDPGGIIDWLLNESGRGRP